MKLSEIKWRPMPSKAQRASIFREGEEYYVLKDTDGVYALYHPMHDKHDKWGLDALELAAYLTLFTPEVTDDHHEQGN